MRVPRVEGKNNLRDRAGGGVMAPLPCRRKHKPTLQWCGFPACRRAWPLRVPMKALVTGPGPLPGLDPAWKIAC